MNKFIFSIILLVACACSDTDRPDHIMDKDKMVNYLIDLHLTEAAMRNIRLDSDSAKIVFSVQEKYMLRQHNITDSIFIASYTYYLDNPSILEEIYGAVVDSISLRQSLLNEAE